MAFIPKEDNGFRNNEKVILLETVETLGGTFEANTIVTLKGEESNNSWDFEDEAGHAASCCDKRVFKKIEIKKGI